MENIIEIKNLSKSFGEVKAVQGLSFRVEKGELFAFLGVNGAGKSTTISIICGSLQKDGGSVLVCGNEAGRQREKTARKLGVVFQNSVLDKSLSVKDNLESRAALYGLSKKEVKARIEELSKLLDFESILNRTVGKLSGGQRRRAMAARALIHNPDLILADEPTNDLDEHWSTEMIRILKEQTQKGTAVVMVTHNSTWPQHATRRMRLEDGVLSDI